MSQSCHIQIKWKIYFSVIRLMATRPCQIIAHAITAQFSCHVQNVITATYYTMDTNKTKIPLNGYEQNKNNSYPIYRKADLEQTQSNSKTRNPDSLTTRFAAGGSNTVLLTIVILFYTYVKWFAW